MCCGICRHYNKESRETLLVITVSAFYTSYSFKGILLVAVSLWILASNLSNCAFSRHFIIPACIALASGIVTIISGIYGLIQTRRKRNNLYIRCFLLIFSGVSCLLLSASVLSSIYSSEVSSGAVLQKMDVTLQNFIINNNDASANCWDELQTTLKCCAFTNLTHLIKSSNSSGEKLLNFCDCKTKRDCVIQVDGSSQEKYMTPSPHRRLKPSCYPLYANDMSLKMDVLFIFTTSTLCLDIVHFLASFVFAMKSNNQSVVDIYRVE